LFRVIIRDHAVVQVAVDCSSAATGPCEPLTVTLVDLSLDKTDNGATLSLQHTSEKGRIRLTCSPKSAQS
jgi:hypothetical protein